MNLRETAALIIMAAALAPSSARGVGTGVSDDDLARIEAIFNEDAAGAPCSYLVYMLTNRAEGFLAGTSSVTSCPQVTNDNRLVAAGVRIIGGAVVRRCMAGCAEGGPERTTVQGSLDAIVSAATTAHPDGNPESDALLARANAIPGLIARCQ